MCKEINKRWPEIKELFNEIKEGNKPIENLKYFAKRILREDDMFVFAKISKEFHDFTYIGDASFLKNIIDGHVKYKDLKDRLDNTINFLHDYKNEETALNAKSKRLTASKIQKKLNDQFADRISKLSENLPEKIGDLDSKYKSIFKYFDCPLSGTDAGECDCYGDYETYKKLYQNK